MYAHTYTYAHQRTLYIHGFTVLQSDTDDKTFTPQHTITQQQTNSGTVPVKDFYKHFKLRTYDPGYMNTALCTSKITMIDGENGILRHRGYPIEQLAEQSTFLEVAYLCVYGDLPSAKQLTYWTQRIMRHTYVHSDLGEMMGKFRYDAHPMGMMISSVSALSTLHPEANPALAGQVGSIQSRSLASFNHARFFACICYQTLTLVLLCSVLPHSIINLITLASVNLITWLCYQTLTLAFLIPLFLPYLPGCVPEQGDPQQVDSLHHRHNADLCQSLLAFHGPKHSRLFPSFPPYLTGCVSEQGDPQQADSPHHWHHADDRRQRVPPPHWPPVQRACAG
jgi:hypothetical protein